MTACVSLVGPGDVADDLRRRDRPGEERERRGRVVALLDFQACPIDGRAVQAGRGAGLQPAHGKAEAVQRIRQADRRRLYAIALKLRAPCDGAAGGDLDLAAVDQSLQEGAGRQHHGGGAQSFALRRDHTADASIRQDQILGGAFTDFQVYRGFQRRPHSLAIKFAVGLGAGPSHRRTLAPIEDAELDSGGIGDAPHQPVGGIDLAHQVALADPADGGIARHFAQRGALVGE